MKGLIVAMAFALAFVCAPTASAAGWVTPAGTTNVVADSVITGGGYPVPPGATRPDPGTCRSGLYNANRSESWIAVKPGTETLVGNSKIFFEKFSTFYDFHLGAYTIQNGAVTGANQVQGYDCVSTGTQDDAAELDEQHRPERRLRHPGPRVPDDAAVQRVLGGRPAPERRDRPLLLATTSAPHWIKGNGGSDLEPNNNQTSLTLRPRRGQAVGRRQPLRRHPVPGPRLRDVDDVQRRGAGTARSAWPSRATAGRRSRRRSRSRRRARRRPATTYVYPSVGADGTLYVAFVGGFDTTNKNRVGHVYVTKSLDDGVTFGPFVEAATPGENPNGFLPNTNFRDGIIENFAASPDLSGPRLPDLRGLGRRGGQFDVKFTPVHRRRPDLVAGADGERRAQLGDDRPVPAVGRGGARTARSRSRSTTAAPRARTTRASCPTHVGDANTCIDVSLQAYKDAGTAAAPCRSAATSASRSSPGIPTSPQQKVGGITQYACAGHTDPCPHGPRLHRRLLRARDLGRQRLHVRRLHALPVADGHRRRRRAGLLPEPGARNRAAIFDWGRLLTRFAGTERDPCAAGYGRGESSGAALRDARPARARRLRLAGVGRSRTPEAHSGETGFAGSTGRVR